jgi:MFS family permease
MRTIKLNITYLTIIKYSKWFMLFMPVIIKFYKGSGFSMSEIITLQAIYSISMLLFEIPSGYSADIFGRRFTLIIGTVCGFLGFSIYSMAGPLWHFIIAEIIMGLGMSFVSGADSAMLYDSLFEAKKQDQYSKYEGRVTATGNFAEAIAGIVGGSLAFWLTHHFPGGSLQTIFLFQSIVALTGVPAALLLVEPQRHAPSKKGALRNILKISKTALVDNRLLRYYILFSAIIGSATLTMAWFVQELFAQMGISNEKHLGYLWALLNVSVGVFTLVGYKVDRALGSFRTMLLIAVTISSGYMALWFDIHYWALAVILVFYFVRGIATPVLKDYINRITESQTRATVLSLRSFIIRITFSILGPFIGWMSDKDLNKAMLYTGLFYLLLTLSILVLVRKTQMRTDNPS